jgi:hypothetical protein
VDYTKEAATFAAELRQGFDKDSSYLFQVACGYALAAAGVGHGKSERKISSEERAQRQRYLDLALESLRQATAKGYEDIRSLRTEPDLDPLRQEPGFQQLLRESGAPGK